MIKPTFVEELISKADIVGIISKFVQLNKKGANYFGLCPFHPDTNPSMSVSSKKNFFKCFSCGTSGNVINFVQKYKKISFIEAIREVALMSGYSEDEIQRQLNSKNNDMNAMGNWRLINLNNTANQIFKDLLFFEGNKSILEYLLNRKISLETIKQFEIGFSSKDNIRDIVYNLLTNKDNLFGENRDANLIWNEDELLKNSLISINDETKSVHDYFYNRITFPIYDHLGILTGFIGRTINPQEKTKYLLSSSNLLFNKSKTLYNFNQVVNNKNQSLILLEGNLDVISIYEAKNSNNVDEINDYDAVALMGTALTNDHILLLKKHSFIKNIILWFDNDEAGRLATINNGLKLVQNNFNVFVVDNSTELKDVNDILVKSGKHAINDLIINKKEFLLYYIDNKFAKAKAIDKLSFTEEILKMIAMYGNTLQRSQYFELISKHTNFNINDINQKFEEILQIIKAVKKYSVGTVDYGYTKVSKVDRQIDTRSNQQYEEIEPNETIPQKKYRDINYLVEIQKNYNSLRSAMYDMLKILVHNWSFANKAFSEIYFKTDSNAEIETILFIIKQIILFDKLETSAKNATLLQDYLNGSLTKKGIEFDLSSFFNKNYIEHNKDPLSKISNIINQVNVYYLKIQLHVQIQKLNALNIESSDYKNLTNSINSIREQIVKFNEK